MSKADKLRASASFARAQPVSSRRAAIAAATGVATDGVAPPATARLHLLAHNPFNPRDELTDLEETAASLKEKGQIQPVAVVRRAVFLTVHPGQEEALGDAEYVVIDGNRRLAAATLAGLPELRIDVNDDLATSAADILESALIANIHRVDVPPINQAKAIQELLEKHEKQVTVARRLGKTEAWVSQRLALLSLPEDLQEKIETGELKVKEGRRIGRLPAAQQHPEAEKALNRVKEPRKPRASTAAASGVGAVDTPGQSTSVATAEIPVPTQGSESTPGSTPAGTRVLNPVKTDAGTPAPDVPWDDPAQMIQVLRKNMSADHLSQLAVLLADGASAS
ncbi:ParB/RepB/Spo0J family partition protein [Streptomyces beijiangensis]|uniref:ParB/RepB/Spo0J family partition protein n=1 Tax=Streptomyces beijiangensis TaxID=163361 RepID=A0A939JIB5_9ACTN|nr:ParB/RepB/Spo0J family partition protein [Streptomyces beijiangensis]MBO0512389.1 ParB/RepB/Spo0J family partition protein [Streptomyces beijiangensis]